MAIGGTLETEPAKTGRPAGTDLTVFAADDYAERVREYLAEERRYGADFDSAWCRTMEEHPPPRSWRQRIVEEPAIDFLARVMRAAYEECSCRP